MSDEPMQQLGQDDPRVVAFAKYAEGERYANTFKWAAEEHHRKGSLWAAFIEGWEAAVLYAASAKKDGP